MSEEPVLKLPRKRWVFYRKGFLGPHYMIMGGKWFEFNSMGSMVEVAIPPEAIYDPAVYERKRMA